MIAIGNGEACPFCKGDDKFISKQGKDFIEHMVDKHQDEMDKFLFGGADIGM